MVLLGDPVLPSSSLAGGPAVTEDHSAGGSAESPTPMDYFGAKNPKSKVEMLAVAARYREEYEDSETHSKEQLKKVITDARRNFDAHNFARDISNAKSLRGLFNTSGRKRDANKLSYYGQQFVDALPDREAAMKIPKPKVRGRKKAAKK
jgi:hypothetical protein